MMHIDIAVENLDEAVAWAVDAGATLAGHQPQKHVRVMLGPAGHPSVSSPGGSGRPLPSGPVANVASADGI